MKNQTIAIGKLGQLKNIKLNVSDFLVLIGPQASGESTITKAIYFFKSLRDVLDEYLVITIGTPIGSHNIDTFKKRIVKVFSDFWGTTFYFNEVDVKYQYNNSNWIHITLSAGEKFIKVNLSDKLSKEISDLCDLANDRFNFDGMKAIPFEEVSKYKTEINEFNARFNIGCKKIFNDDKALIFIPAGRSLLSTISNQLNYVDLKLLDFTLRQFILLVNGIRPVFYNKSLRDLVLEKAYLSESEIDFKHIEHLEKLVASILKGKYKFDKDGEKIYFEEDEFAFINHSSSGQQEAIWILQLIFIFLLDARDVFMVIEEPESNLYPEAQKQMVEAISLLQNGRNNQVIITTHSPYILASVNNLLYAHKIGQKEREKVASKINPATWIPVDKLGAYSLKKNGLKNIFDKKLLSIETEAIDSASGMINADYEFLFNLDND